MRFFSAPKYICKVAIQDLPNVASSLTEGGIYGITITNKLIRNIFILRNIEAFLKINKQIVFITHNPGDWYQSLSEAERHMGLDVLSSIRFTEFVGTLHHNIKSHGVNRLLIEVEDIVFTPKSIVLIDTTKQNTGWDEDIDIESIGYKLKKWIGLWKHIALFISPQTNIYTHPCFLEFRRHQIFDGMAELNSDSLRLSWHVEFWNGKRSNIDNKTYGIYFHKEHYSLQADGASIDARSGKLLYAPDEDQVLMTRQDVQGENHYPESWTIYDDFDQLLSSLGTAVAATVIITYEKSLTFLDILNKVISVRQLTGPTLKVIVRERNVSLRYYQEAVLLNSGANMVVSRNDNTSRLLRAIESLKGDCYKQDTSITDEEINKILGGAEISGYLPLKKFCNFVSQKLDHTRILNIQSALIKLELLPDIPIVDAIRDFQPKRSSDVISADKSAIYIFLYACRSPDITTALVSLFSQGVDPLYSYETQITSFEGIRDTIEELKKAAKSDAPVDYSLYFVNR